VKELLPQYPPVLHLYYVHKFTEPSKWYQAKTMFTRSVACWSIIGYILGLGDGHAKNVLLNKKTGVCIHVDFAVLFNKGELLPIPETITFHLTHKSVLFWNVLVDNSTLENPTKGIK
jgi:phosphatidylinositol kinase/protein kinase (PI-3  family)